MIVIIDKGKAFKTERFYWHVTAKNGRVLCHSEMYNSKRAAQKGIEACKDIMSKCRCK